MKKIISIVVILFAVAPLYALDAEIRIGGGYLWLLRPSLHDIGARPKTNVHYGGGAASLQVMLGDLPDAKSTRFGTEIGYLRLYRFDTIDGNPDEGTLTSVPVLAVIERVFSPGARFSPFMQAGVGSAFTKLELEHLADRITTKDTDFAVMAGPGMTMRVNDNMNVAALIKYYVLFGRGDNTEALSLTVNVGFKL